MRRILLFGDRNWTDREAIEIMLRACGPGTEDTLVHGAARGADTFGCQSASLGFRMVYAADAARELGFGSTIARPARWEEFGPSAGPRRNQEMLHEIQAVLPLGGKILAFGFHADLEQSKGTKDMVGRLRKAGIEPRLIT